MRHFIITGGLGAGKTVLTNRLVKAGFVYGSPAHTMKVSLARALSREWSWDGDTLDPLAADVFIDEMNNQATKTRYRLLLQGYGEYFTNIDNSHWIERTMRSVEASIQAHRFNDGHIVDPPGTVYDSIRTPAEVRGVRQVYPDALRVHLDVSPTRQMEFLVQLGNTLEQAATILAHSSEHWFEGAPDDVQPDIILDANEGDHEVELGFVQWCGNQKYWDTVKLLLPNYAER